MENGKYRVNLIALEFKGLSPPQLLARLDSIKESVFWVLTNTPQNKALSNYLLFCMHIAAKMMPLDTPTKSDEIEIKDLEKLSSWDLLEFLLDEPGNSTMKPVLKEFFMKSLLKGLNKQSLYN